MLRGGKHGLKVASATRARKKSGENWNARVSLQVTSFTKVKKVGIYRENRKDRKSCE
jgi:hypothetical protein